MKLHSESAVIEELRRSLAAGKPTTHEFEDGSVLHVERSLPFLLVHRRASEAASDITTFIRAHPSYVALSAQLERERFHLRLVRSMVETLAQPFRNFMVLELWAGPELTETGTQPPRASFRVHALRGANDDGVLDVFERELGRIRISKRLATVQTEPALRCAPPGRKPLVSSDLAAELKVQCYGLEIAPIHRNPATGEPYPLVLRNLRRELTRALRKTLYRFSVNCTDHQPPHFHSLGRSAVSKPVWESDRRIAAVCEQFDFLMLVTPVNGQDAWAEFRRGRFRKAPSLHYRPIPADPLALKRELYKAPVERVLDPALSLLFREKIVEVDRQITMLQDRNSGNFLPESIQLYGAVKDDLYAQAQAILAKIGPAAHRSDSSDRIDSKTFAKHARSELAFLRKQHPDLQSAVEVRSDVASLMVSRGRLLVGEDWSAPRKRVDALIQHEIGTHVVTHANGCVQPFRQLRAGLAGYEALQEGLAVTAEYLVGGLNRARLRLLAIRVVSIRSMQSGGSFVDTFELLHDEYGVPARMAFNITLRTHRGGGLTKDALYLEGLQQVLRFLARGGELEELFIGKIALRHLDIIRELRWRGVLKPPPLKPRYLTQKDALERLQKLRTGRTPIELLESKRKSK